MTPVKRKLRALLLFSTIGVAVAAGGAVAQNANRIQLFGEAGNFAPPVPDFLPNAFGFSTQSNVDPDGLPVQSNQVTITGINQTVNVTVSDDGTGSDPRVKVNNGPFLTSTTLQNNDRLTVSVLPANNAFSTEYRAIVTVGEGSATFTATTRAVDMIPDAFSFSTQSNITPGTTVNSNPVTLSGFDLPVEASLTGTDGSPQFRISGGGVIGEWTNPGATGMAGPGDVVEIRISAGPEDSSRSATLTVGGVSATFTVNSIPAPDACEIGAVGTVCEDGAIYVGNLASGPRIYAAAADEPTTFAQSVVAATTSTLPSPQASSLNDPIYNTNWMMLHEVNHPAAAACRAKGGDWFLPANANLNTLYQAASAGHVPGLTDAAYWSSTLVLNSTTYSRGHTRNLVSGATSNFTTTTTQQRVRCMRVGPEPSPIVVSFPSISDVPPSFLTESASSTITGLIRTEMLSVTGEGSPQMSVSSGPWSSNVLVSPGDTIRVRMNSSPTFGATRTASIRLSGVEKATFTVSTEAGLDCQTGPVGTRCISDSSIYVGNTVNGIRMYMSSANDGTASWKSVNTLTALTLNGTQQVESTSSADGLLNTNILVSDSDNHPAADICRSKGAEWYLPSPAEMITITGNLSSIPSWVVTDPTQIVWTSTNNNTGATTRRFNGAGSIVNRTQSNAVRCVRTDSDDWNASGSFAFSNKNSQPRNQISESDEVVISGLRNPGAVAISVNGDGNPEISIDGGTWSTSGTITSTQRLRVRLTAAGTISTTSTATVTVGSVTSDFSITTFGDCTIGAVGTACESDGAIYGGTNAAGERMYISASNDNVVATRWKSDTSATAGATSAADGKENMTAIITAGIASHPAADICQVKGLGWYLPAVDELQVFFGAGIIPSVTGTRYWSSTEVGADTTRAIASDGTVRNRTKTETTSNNVRCVRN
jgi:hypothetical protein